MYHRGLYKSLVNECCNPFKTRGECLDLYKHELRVHWTVKKFCWHRSLFFKENQGVKTQPCSTF